MTTNGTEERPNQSPTGWTWVHLGELADFINGDRGKNYPHRSQYVPSGIPFINAGHILSNGTLSIDSMNYISQEKFESLRSGKIKKGDLVYCLRGALGKVAIINQFSEGAIASSLVIVRPNSEVNATYLFYFLISPLGKLEIEKYDNGTAQPNLSAKSLKSYLLPLPPEAEQKRIVAEIEKQFTRLDQAVASLKRLQSNLARYKASLLKAACEGRLVPQDANDEPAADLLTRILAERRAQWQAANPGKKYKEPNGVETAVLPGLPEGWVWASLEQVTGLITSGSRGWGKYYSDEGVIFIRAQDINTDSLKLDSTAHVALPDSVEGTRAIVNQNDLLITITGANVTKTALVYQELEEAYVSQHVGLVKPIFTEISEYLYYWIISPTHGRAILEKDAYGAGKPGLSLGNLRELRIAVPPLAEQERIVAEVERRLSVVSATEQAITTNLARAERLRQSILGRAFTGQLVPQTEGAI